MNIFIPTRGRSGNQKTYDSLPPFLQARTFLVVDAKEEKEYRDHCGNVLVLPRSVRGIASIRQYIIENAGVRFIVMLDDDLTFQIKKRDGKIINSTPKQIDSAFHLLDDWLEGGFAHVGMSIRSISHRQLEPFNEATRMMHVLGYNTEKVLASGCSFTKGVTKNFSMDDFHMTLQLLKKGYPNRVSMKYVTSPSTSNAKGGASEWRTLDSHNSSAKQLKKNHKDYVLVKQKHGWQGMEGDRYDVVVQWKKAYGDS